MRYELAIHLRPIIIMPGHNRALFLRCIYLLEYC